MSLTAPTGQLSRAVHQYVSAGGINRWQHRLPATAIQVKCSQSMPFKDLESVRREVERLSLSMKALGAGVWDWDIEADVLVCNQRWYEMLGIDPIVDRVSVLSDFAKFIHPEDAAMATEVDPLEVDRLIAADEPYHREYRIVRTDGKIRWWRSVASVVRDPETGRHRGVGCVTDITEQFAKDATDDLNEVLGTASGAPIGQAKTSLSKRERECLLWVSAGKTAWETGVILGVGRRTVEFHIINAVRKLGAANKVHAAALAIHKGLL